MFHFKTVDGKQRLTCAVCRKRDANIAKHFKMTGPKGNSEF